MQLAARLPRRRWRCVAGPAAQATHRPRRRQFCLVAECSELIYLCYLSNPTLFIVINTPDAHWLWEQRQPVSQQHWEEKPWEGAGHRASGVHLAVQGNEHNAMSHMSKNKDSMHAEQFASTVGGGAAAGWTKVPPWSSGPCRARQSWRGGAGYDRPGRATRCCVGCW